MTELVPPGDIERIVGVERHDTMHYARAVSAEQTVYILHSKGCKDSTPDLRDCRWSRALDNGIAMDDWTGSEDRPVQVGVRWGDDHTTDRLVPVR